MPLDETDLRILSVLQTNARISNQELADRVGITPSPCLRRVRQLELDGVIEGYFALINPRSVGRALQAFVEIKLDHQIKAAVDSFEAEIRKFPEVLECYLMAGDWDYLLRVAVADLEEFRDFHMSRLARIPGISNVKSNIVMKQAKRSAELAL